ncbi:MAG: Plug domain-containing protein [Bacteroidota bacterium]|nr:Plug domain-containing protein [Bacteroidota bacterium]
MVQGQLELPKNIEPGQYTLKAYTRWSQNYGLYYSAIEQIQIGDLDNVIKTPSEHPVTITPEGGTLVNGYKNRIIIKTPTNGTLEPINKGKIIDENHKEIAKVTFFANGLGSAVFEPEENKTYHLELKNGRLVPLPKVTSEGYLLHVNNLDDSNASIRITASSGAQEHNILLVGTSGGLTYFEKKLNFQNGKVLDLELDKSNFPFGVFVLKLVDNLGAELAKRPIWIAPKKLHIAIDNIGKDVDRGLKTYKVRITDRNNKPVKSKLAISINRVQHDGIEKLNSGFVGQKGLFNFSNGMDGNKVSVYRKESFLKDLYVLSSNGEIVTQFLDEDVTKGVRFPFQKGLEISGRAYDLNNMLLRNTKIHVMASSDEDLWIGEVETDAMGFLRLKDIQIEGKATLVARTDGDETKSRLVKIVPLSEFEQQIGDQKPVRSKNPQQSEYKKPEGAESLSMELPEKTIELDEVEVSKENTKRNYTPSLYGPSGPFTKVIRQDFENPKTLAQMLMSFPGVIVRGAETLSPSVKIMGTSGTILWVLDGFPLSQGGSGAQMGTSAASPLNEISALANNRDIERIELLKGPDASMYGSRASAGVFVIYTRKGNEQEFVRRKEGQLDFEGYVIPMDFNQYKESLPPRKGKKMNLVYWNPKLETDENGEAVITFPTFPDNAKVKIEITTVSADGEIGFASLVD